MTETNEETWEERNVSLWLNNDRPLYRMKMEAIESTRDLGEAAAMLLAELKGAMLEATPDGAKYTHDNIEAAIQGDHENFWEVQ